MLLQELILHFKIYRLLVFHNIPSSFHGKKYRKLIIKTTAGKLKKRIKLNEDSPEYLAFKFVLETNQKLHNKTTREIRKQYCMTRYRELENSKLKRSEKVKIIAKELGVKKNCIQVYLREIFKGI